MVASDILPIPAARPSIWSPPRTACYPWSVLGLPLVWYESSAYRSRAVIDPRGVLAAPELPARKHDWAEAYRHTPNGQPVESPGPRPR